ncbi:ribokinase [Heyndrickxia acidiproducens]|uniref:ribokinase n=1 Tax=Heyndrickxia acidiproducens TaxID=1121084 RepID=UPI00036A91B5|nr:ribokinase [Heyndrickxia acidiproducens]
MKFDIVVVGSINMDVVASCEKYPQYGDTEFCHSIRMLPGGKGANQAASAAHLGKRVAMVGSVGKDSAGNQMLENLRSKGVDVSGVIETDKAGTGTFIALVDESGENTMVGTKGANDALTEQDIETAFSGLEAKILLIQMETSKESILAAMKLAKQRGMFVILDPAPAGGITPEAFQYADLVLPNSQETEAITGIQVTDEESALMAAEKIRALGIPNVIVKLGGKGSLVYQGGKATFVRSIEVKAVDTVGAGDCYAGAIADALIDTNDLAEAARFASIAAGIKVSRTGGQDAIPTLKEVQNYSRPVIG